jgi:hypothetical protein
VFPAPRVQKGLLLRRGHRERREIGRWGVVYNE